MSSPIINFLKRFPYGNVLAVLTSISLIAAFFCWFNIYHTQKYEPPQPVSHPVLVLSETPEAPFEEKTKKHKIAIVIDDMGGSFKQTKLAIDILPPEITFSFLPLGASANKQALEAKTKGHDILLHIPMEPLLNVSPGKGALLTSLSDAEIKNRLINMMRKFTANYKGVNNHMGSKFTTDERGMNIVLDILKEKNLYFLDSRTNKESIAFDMAKEKGLPTAKRDVFLDNEEGSEEVQRQLERLEDIALANGYAIAIGHPHTATIQTLAEWIPLAEAMGFEIVPMSALTEEM
ncbi:MAG: divergent polysaccharide deacetylase family protein [Alphaproteobacteria bacterium]|nr:divergent polysaccharide deacetylase family protein [Alphaproteobacteria bacterium]